jgi:hypothetical protein
LNKWGVIGRNNKQGHKSASFAELADLPGGDPKLL